MRVCRVRLKPLVRLDQWGGRGEGRPMGWEGGGVTEAVCDSTLWRRDPERPRSHWRGALPAGWGS